MINHIVNNLYNNKQKNNVNILYNMDRKLNKSLKKENEKKDTQIKQLQKATFIPIIRPSKFINPFRFYKIEPHVYLGEIERKIIISMDYISHFKSVSHVQISSPFNNFLTIGFSDGFNDVFTPQEYLFARLRSFGDSNLFEWANLIRSPNSLSLA